MTVSFKKDQIVSATDFVRSFSKYLEQTETEGQDIFIFKRNEPEAVVVSYDRYEEMRDKIEKMELLLEQLSVKELIEERKASPVKDISVSELKQKYGL